MKLILQLYVALLLLLGAPLDTLLDREHGLPSWYDPGMREEVFDAWIALQSAAIDESIKITLFSGYRSYEYQAEIYAREAFKHKSGVNLYTARPGHSEHQLGTAIDVAWPGVGLSVHDPRNKRLYTWLAKNAHIYGFVLSYPYKSAEVWPYHNRWMPVVTEYIHEPWHIRYVGVALAKKIYDAGYLDPASPVLPQHFYHPWP